MEPALSRNANDGGRVFGEIIPSTAAKEFGVGTAVGGILGGGQMAAAEVQQQSSILGSAARRLISNENLTRYRSVIDSVFSGDYPSQSIIQMGETPEILLQYGASQHPLTLTQNTAYKIAYLEGYFGGKHNLGMSVLKQLPYQIADPIAIIKSTSQPDSLIVLTKWKDGNADVIVPIHLNKRGVIEAENRIASAYGKGHIDSILGENGENILYTKNDEDIHQLLDKGVQFPQLFVDDILAKKSIANPQGNVKPKVKKSYQILQTLPDRSRVPRGTTPRCCAGSRKAEQRQ